MAHENWGEWTKNDRGLLQLSISEDAKRFLESLGVRITGTSPSNYRLYSYEEYNRARSFRPRSGQHEGQLSALDQQDLAGAGATQPTTPTGTTGQTFKTASPLSEATNVATLPTYDVIDPSGRVVASTTDPAAAQSQGFTTRLRSGTTETPTGTGQVGDPLLPTREEILELFALGKAAGGFDRAEAFAELKKLGFPDIQINTMLGPAPVQLSRTGSIATEGIQFEELADDQTRQENVGRGREGIFDVLTNPFASGLSGAGRRAVGRRFAPLEASFLTNQGLSGFGSSPGTSFEDFLGSGPQPLSRQELFGRLERIGQGVGNVSGDEADFLETFDDPQTRRTFITAANQGVNPRFRQIRASRLNREFDQFLFDNPLETLIGGVGQGRFR